MKKISILILALFLMLGCAVGKKEEEIKLVPFKMGEVLELKTLKLQVLEVHELDSIPGKFGELKAEKGVKIISVKLEVENISDDDIIINEKGFDLLGDDGLYYYPLVDVGIIDPVVNQEIPPKKSFVGYLYYGVGESLKDYGLVAGHAETGVYYKYELKLTDQVEVEQKEEVKPKEKEEVIKKEPVPEISIGKKNAKKSAENYIKFMPFSREGLIKQLNYEGYSAEEATYAVDNIIVDWNEQAVKSAQSYLDTMSFSRQGLIDQLIFEGYTYEQAEYGVNGVGY